MRIEAVLVLDLEVIVGGEEGELDRLEEPLQIRLAGRGDERGLTPRGPSMVSAASEAPTEALTCIRSASPSRCLISMTELRALLRLAGKAPV